jgi:hypothetical protein
MKDGAFKTVTVCTYVLWNWMAMKLSRRIGNHCESLPLLTFWRKGNSRHCIHRETGRTELCKDRCWLGAFIAENVKFKARWDAEHYGRNERSDQWLREP